MNNKAFTPDKIRNVGIIAHSGAGKTTLAEAILYDAGAINKRGKTSTGDTVMDFDPEEIKRNISISTSIASCEWKDHKINLLDTPGDQNFVGDTFLSMSVMDSALVIVSAVSGIKTQTERVWNWACAHKLPRVIFINKMDNDRASYESAFGQIDAVFHQKTLKFTLPIGSGPAFKGVVDLLYMKAYIYAKDGEGKFTVEEIPDNLLKWAQKERREMVESVAETDERLLNIYMEKNTLEDAELFPGLRRAIVAGEVVPVLCGSATLNVVIRKTLDTIVNFLPSPADMPPRLANGPDGKLVDLPPAPEGPLAAYTFKTLVDPFAGRLSYLRVFSGSISPDSNLYNSSKGAKEHIGPLLTTVGKKQTPVSKAVTGDIVAVAKLKSASTGDTLCDPKSPVTFMKEDPPHPVVALAVEAKSKGDEDKLTSSLAKLMEEDPTLHFEMDKETKDLVISGMGQIHMDVTLSRLKSRYGLEVSTHPPKIAYRETIRGKADGHGRLKKQTGGHGQFADCKITVEPGTDGTAFEFVNAIVGGVIPRQYIPGIEKGVKEAMADGVLAGYQMMGIKVTVFDGQYHEVDSSEIAFKIAAAQAFRLACAEARPVLLEPVMDVEIVVPEECVGDIMAGVAHRRGRVTGVGVMGGDERIKALMPMAEILDYDQEMRSVTGGRGDFSTHFASYEEAPPNIAQKIVAESKKARENK
ncbi:MAG: elongation factor G [Nitrospinae bacterium]|nr:elongation factor G [Nitrospinota bacterium]